GDPADPATAELIEVTDRGVKGGLVLTFGGGGNEVQRELITMLGLSLPRPPRRAAARRDDHRHREEHDHRDGHADQEADQLPRPVVVTPAALLLPALGRVRLPPLRPGGPWLGGRV